MKAFKNLIEELSIMKVFTLMKKDWKILNEKNSMLKGAYNLNILDNKYLISNIYNNNKNQKIFIYSINLAFVNFADLFGNGHFWSKVFSKNLIIYFLSCNILTIKCSALLNKNDKK